MVGFDDVRFNGGRGEEGDDNGLITSFNQNEELCGEDIVLKSVSDALDIPDDEILLKVVL